MATKVKERRPSEWPPPEPDPATDIVERVAQRLVLCEELHARAAQHGLGFFSYCAGEGYTDYVVLDLMIRNDYTREQAAWWAKQYQPDYEDDDKDAWARFALKLAKQMMVTKQRLGQGELVVEFPVSKE